MSVSTRRTGRDVAVAGAGGTQRFFFGPLQDGEFVSSIRLYCDMVAVVAGETIDCEVKVFAIRPPDTAVAFLVNGRSITEAMSLPVLVRAFDLTLNVVGDSEDRFVGVELTNGLASTVNGGLVLNSLGVLKRST